VDFNPVKNKDLTLYDVERNPQVSKKYFNYSVDGLAIQNKYIDLLKSQKILTLLPIQAISIEKGLLKERSNQLIMAPTSAGKTLVGELAGISRILSDKKKFI
jgi:superfamily II helicase